MFWLDTAIVGVLIVGAAFGALSGFLWQAARLVGFAGAIYAAILANPWAAGLLQAQWLRDADPGVARVAAYVLVFLSVCLSIFLITWLLKEGVKAARLEAVDRLLGAVVGGLKAGLVVAAFCFVLASFPQAPTGHLLEQSSLAPTLAGVMESVLVVVPAEYKESLEKSWRVLRERTLSGKEEPKEVGKPVPAEEKHAGE